jgi:hypothetical protein
VTKTGQKGQEAPMVIGPKALARLVRQILDQRRKKT